MKQIVGYFFIRLITFPFALLPPSWIHTIGKALGSLSYHLYPKFRKRTLSNLALVLTLEERALISLAKKSMQNLMITLLEYAKLSHLKNIHSMAYCHNPEKAAAYIREGKGVIFFCGHQSNWEILFLEGTKRMPGVAIGRPVKNGLLYEWILSIRQKNGGKIITPQNAIREGLKALKKGAFLGIVGDQGMPDSGYCSDFFGKRAWTSPIAALLSYRTGLPIMVATTEREKGRYRITYSDPIFPDQSAPQNQEVDRLMKESLAILEKTIREKPEEWLWQHNRWKQQTVGTIKRAYRQESILIILPPTFSSTLSIVRELYPLEFISVFCSAQHIDHQRIPDAEYFPYYDLNECFVRDYRYKLIFNLTDNPRLSKHFLKLGAVKAVDMPHFTPEQLQELVLANAR
jgi:KDO2-lipid IV(A) lauroyltransferase